MKRKFKKIIDDLAFLWQFSVDDFKLKYAGSVLGFLWAFLQPMVTIIMYWFVFQLGFRSQPVEDFPFALWLMSGLIPWFFVSEAIINATTSLADYSYLVKKVLFNIEILPIAKVVSVLFVQFGLILFLIICFSFGGYYPAICYIKVVIYIAYMLIFTIAISYITSTLFVFFKDTIQVVSIAMQAFFWLTPIVYSQDSMPKSVTKILAFNPSYYIVSGFRNVFIYRIWNGSTLPMIIYYWGVALLLLFVGVRLFKRCKKHFADVL